MMEAEEQGLPGLSSCWEPAGHREQLSGSWHGEKTRWGGLVSSGWGSDSSSPGVCWGPAALPGGAELSPQPWHCGSVEGGQSWVLCVCVRTFWSEPSSLLPPGSSVPQGCLSLAAARSREGRALGRGRPAATQKPPLPSPRRPDPGWALVAVQLPETALVSTLCCAPPAPGFPVWALQSPGQRSAGMVTPRPCHLLLGSAVAPGQQRSDPHLNVKAEQSPAF